MLPEATRSQIRLISDHLHRLLQGDLPPALPAPTIADAELTELTEQCNRVTAVWIEIGALAHSLSEGHLDYDAPSGLSPLMPLKQLQARLRHLTWQTQQIAQGDFSQRVEFMGDFSRAFNQMVDALFESKANTERMISQLQTARDQLGVLLESISLVLIGLDGQGRILRWNRTAEEIFGFRAAEMQNLPFAQSGLPWVPGVEMVELQTRVASNQEGLIRDVPISRAGRDCYLDITVTRVEPPAGQAPASDSALRLLLVGVDVTARRLHEIAQGQEQKLEAIGHLASGLAHEINTPLQVIASNLSFCQEGMASLIRMSEAKEDDDRACLSPEDRDYLRGNLPQALAESVTGVRQVSAVVQALKAFIRADHGDDHALANVNSELENTLLITGNQWKDIAEVVRHFDPELPEILCYPRPLLQALFNILFNAIQAVEAAIAAGKYPRGTLTLTTARRPEGIEIRIADDGLGIPAEIQPRIFNPFFSTRPVGHGAGQGLYIARQIVVQRHRGRLWFETAAGLGSTFIVFIPDSV